MAYHDHTLAELIAAHRHACAALDAYIGDLDEPDFAHLVNGEVKAAVALLCYRCSSIPVLEAKTRYVQQAFTVETDDLVMMPSYLSYFLGSIVGDAKGSAH